MRRWVLPAFLSVVLAGCSPVPSAAWQGDPRLPAPPTETGKAEVDDCSRQFDENEAGFQTCLP